jgi:glycosyltransferase involved in cell wall biosynthesis
LKPKVIRTATVAISLDILLKGQLQFLNQQFNIIAISGDDVHLKNVRTRERVETIAIKIERQISPINDLVSLFKLYKTFKKEKPQIVHSITPKAGLLSMIAAYFAGVPIRMHTFTGLIFPSKTGFLKRILIILDKVLCLFATNIYPEGQGVKDALVAYKITNKPLHIIANGNINGIDLDYFVNANNYNNQQQLKAKLNISEADFVFIFVGRLVRDKGINELISVFDKLNNNFINTKLLLVGPFEQENDPILPCTLQKLNNHKAIISVGHQADVRPYFEIADVLVFPSYREGFPNVVIQAGAMNLPSIVTNINGCNEIIIQNKNGLIIEPKDETALFSAMQLLLENKELTAQLKNNARELIKARYDKNIVWDGILNEYRKFVDFKTNV